MYISKALGICFLTFSKEPLKSKLWESLSHTNICLKTLLRVGNIQFSVSFITNNGKVI